jgi:hypothetical protein
MSRWTNLLAVSVSISTNGSTEAKPTIIIPHVEVSGTLLSVELRLLAIRHPLEPRRLDAVWSIRWPSGQRTDRMEWTVA